MSDLGWRSKVGSLKSTMAEIMRSAPYRDFGLVPNQAASEEALASCDQLLGESLPPSYRSFLLQHDGWCRFLDGASLFGAAQIAAKSYRASEMAAMSVREPVNAGGGPLSVRHLKSKAAIVFGIDPQQTTLFAFDPNHRSEDGEMPVVAWIAEVGLRFTNFTEFFAWVAQQCSDELRDFAVSQPTMRKTAVRSRKNDEASPQIAAVAV